MYSLLVLSGLLASCFAQDEGHWDYSVENGPSAWVDNYPVCYGLQQSPIALPNIWQNHTFLRKLEFSGFKSNVAVHIQSNGRTLSIGLKPERLHHQPYASGSLFAPGVHFLLDHVDLHVGDNSDFGSEHIMELKQYPGEIQLMFYDAKYKSFEEASNFKGGIIGVSFFLEVQDRANRQWDPVLYNLHKSNGTTSPVEVGVMDLEWLIPAGCEEYYVYEGSFTSPPCNEVVLWHVFREKIGLSERQFVHLRSLVNPAGVKISNNVRHMQPINGRQVWQHRVKGPTAMDTVALHTTHSKLVEPILLAAGHDLVDPVVEEAEASFGAFVSALGALHCPPSPPMHSFGK